MSDFRERAAVAFWSTVWSNDFECDCEDGETCDVCDDGVTKADVAREAQELADACCEAWGHDVERFAPMEIGAATIAAGPYRSPVHTVCRRCGKKATS